MGVSPMLFRLHCALVNAWARRPCHGRSEVSLVCEARRSKMIELSLRSFDVARKALIVWGGWDGHYPKQLAEIFDRVLKEENFQTELAATLDAFKDEAKLKGLSLIVPIWTMGTLTPEQAKPVFEAVKSGVGMAGVHGGMCDAFRMNTEWQFMTGG